MAEKIHGGERFRKVTDNFPWRPWGWIIPLVVLASLVTMQFFLRKGRDLAVSLSSTAYIVGMLGGAAFAMFPYLLPATINHSYSLTIYNAKI